jgi:hypothetical protein
LAIKKKKRKEKELKQKIKLLEGKQAAESPG